ncbi:MAG: hypothetical protein ABFS86_08290 [Planctomycetota bacterium]
MKTPGPLLIATLLVLLAGCASTDSKVVSKSESELMAMELQANDARALFWSGQYDEAIRIYEKLIREMTVSRPLYEAELACAYLLGGDGEKAYRHLDSAYLSLEGFIDPNSENSAASMWGSEVEKIYKGDPYERATLCLLMGLMYLERNDIDNALACFKNGQLADADVQDATYNSDFGLLQLLEAKCYELRGQGEAADQMIQAAVRSLKQNHGYAMDDENADIEPGYYSDVLAQYTGLLLVWSGQGPRMGRTGRYGEQRVIHPGNQIVSRYALEAGGTRRAALRGFADLGYQSSTRGGRKMDNVLANQAAFKGATEDIGGALIDSANTGNAYADLTLLAVGGIVSLIGSAANPAADIRSWQTLPYEFQIVPLTLGPGVHETTLTGYRYYSPIGQKTIRMEIPDGSVFHVEHVMIGGGMDRAISTRFGADASDAILFDAYNMAGGSLDADGDGEISREERLAAVDAFTARFDVNRDGTLDSGEARRANQVVQSEFQAGHLAGVGGRDAE